MNARTRTRDRALPTLLLLLLLVVGFDTLTKAGETPAKSEGEPVASSATTLIEIVPKLSGVSATYQNGFGIVADIRNTSSTPVWLSPKYVTLTPPPELDPGQDVVSWYASVLGKPMADPTEGKKYEQPVLLRGGETVPAAWFPTDPPCSKTSSWKWITCRGKELFDSLNFVPGDYVMKIVVNYWTTEEDAKQHNDNYRTKASDIKVTVTETQWIIMFGAFWGAIGAYFVVPNVRSITVGTGQKYWFVGFAKDITGITNAALFSIIVTILLARLSDTQFLVKVTVSDFWGAVAIGFLATATRKTILRKIAPAADDNTPHG